MSAPLDLLTSPRHQWRYWRIHQPHVKEMSIAQGHHLALPLHVHQEDQIAFVISGCRHFTLSSQDVFLSAGQAIRIPAGVVHSSRDLGLETLCVNIYTSPGYGDDPADSAALMSAMTNTAPRSIVTIPLCNKEKKTAFSTDIHSTIDAIARRHHMTREAYSRRFRREYGISPQSFQLLERLNTAKYLLRDKKNIADTAIQAGFSDQSHMGRLFRRAFGTTPRNYQTEH